MAIAEQGLGVSGAPDDSEELLQDIAVTVQPSRFR